MLIQGETRTACTSVEGGLTPGARGSPGLINTDARPFNGPRGQNVSEDPNLPGDTPPGVVPEGSRTFPYKDRGMGNPKDSLNERSRVHDRTLQL